MSKQKKTYAVFGLGRYGRAVAKELVNGGAEVLAVDVDEKKVNVAALEIPYCKCADVTNAEVIKQLAIGNIDIVIISMAGNFESSVLAITLCKEAGVKTVIAKCSSEMQQRIFSRAGADRVVYPERDSGVRLAKNLLSSGFVDMMELNKDISIVEIDVLDEWVGKTLIELNLRKKYGFNVIAVSDGSSLSLNVQPDKPFTTDMKLVVIGNVDGLGKLLK